ARVCLRKTRRTETMMDVSMVSRKTRRKMGTEKSCMLALAVCLQVCSRLRRAGGSLEGQEEKWLEKDVGGGGDGSN
ncbi:hypothetical protein OFB99_24455, partial [Escherichia coli]|nr:hypothetical protein [Escherichia coli]